MWKWQKTGRIYLAGEITLLTGLVIWITSLPQIRRKRFEIFYYTHHLYIVFLLFFLFHTGDRHFYMVFPGVFLFSLDKILRMIQSRPEMYILSARIFPSKAIELTLPKDPSTISVISLQFKIDNDMLSFILKRSQILMYLTHYFRVEVRTNKRDFYQDSKDFKFSVASFQYNV